MHSVPDDQSSGSSMAMPNRFTQAQTQEFILFGKDLGDPTKHSHLAARRNPRPSKLPISPTANYLRQAPLNQKLSSGKDKVPSQTNLSSFQDVFQSDKQVSGLESGRKSLRHRYTMNAPQINQQMMHHNASKDSIESKSIMKMNSQSSFGGETHQESMLLRTSDVKHGTTNDKQPDQYHHHPPHLDSSSPMALYSGPIHEIRKSRSKIKTTFKTYSNAAQNSNLSFQPDQIRSPFNQLQKGRSSNQAIQNAQFEKSTQLIRDASIKFINKTSNGECLSSESHSQSNKEFESLKIVQKPRRH